MPKSQRATTTWTTTRAVTSSMHKSTPRNASLLLNLHRLTRWTCWYCNVRPWRSFGSCWNFSLRFQ
eukprot:623749-Pyramimonas_sp.AAC.1